LAPGWGKTFFDAFTAQANRLNGKKPVNNIIQDVVYVGGIGGALPNGVVIPYNGLKDWGLSKAGDALEAHGLDPDMEKGSSPQLVRPLIEIAHLVEAGERNK